jgi:hypothetical protein
MVVIYKKCWHRQKNQTKNSAIKLKELTVLSHFDNCWMTTIYCTKSLLYYSAQSLYSAAISVVLSFTENTSSLITSAWELMSNVPYVAIRSNNQSPLPKTSLTIIILSHVYLTRGSWYADYPNVTSIFKITLQIFKHVQGYLIFKYNVTDSKFVIVANYDINFTCVIYARRINYSTVDHWFKF